MSSATSSPKGVLLTGEPMGLLIAEEAGQLEDVDDYKMSIAGAEYNVAVGLSRLGVDVSYLTKLGTDSVGRRIVRGLRSEGISTTDLVWSDSESTAIMFKGYNPAGDPPIEYFRRNSAASTLSPDDLPDIDWSRFKFLHLTGIMPALSGETWNMCQTLVDLARTHERTVTFDPNLRPQLWADTDDMVRHVNELALRADIVLPGLSEGRLLTDQERPEDICRWYRERGVPAVIVKAGETGAYFESGDDAGWIPGYSIDHVVDTVGAGDGFAAGVLSGLGDGLDFRSAIDRGNAIGAIQVQSRGDNEGLPSREELASYMETHASSRGPVRIQESA